MSQKKVVIASVLKPVNDTRMFEKLGVSLDATNQYDVNIIGFYAKTPKSISNIKFHPIFNFKRLSFGRVLCGTIFYKKLKTIAPNLIIITTHELLWPALIYKFFYGAKIIYDVHENHFRNLLFTNVFPILFRPILASYVRAKEYITSYGIDHFFLAEKYYVKELTFIKNRYTILENKCVNFSKTTSRKKDENTKKINLLFSGTLAQSTGVFDAIKLARSLHEIDQNISLTIIGYTPKESVNNEIKNKIKGHQFIHSIGGNQLVNHQEILKQISISDFGIINYPTNKSTINSTPTKLYEYLSNQLPILMQPHKKWLKICAEYNACIPVNFDEINPKELIDKMKSTKFYPNGVGDEFTWKSEELKLINEVKNVLLK